MMEAHQTGDLPAAAAAAVTELVRTPTPHKPLSLTYTLSKALAVPELAVEDTAVLAGITVLAAGDQFSALTQELIALWTIPGRQLAGSISAPPTGTLSAHCKECIWYRGTLNQHGHDLLYTMY